jgi:hypothetical protein
MSTIDPNAPVQQVGETAANFLYRQQQYNPPTGGPNQGMAKQWVALIVTAAAPSGFSIL